MKNRAVYMIAGPNGSGKTTFAREFLPGYVKCPCFVNADLIAQGLAPFEPSAAALKAGKIVLKEIRAYAERGVDFSFETTLSGKAYTKLLSDLKKKGYSVHLFFLWIPSPELAIARIKERVAEGGHHVPAEDVRRRFSRGIMNFLGIYEPLLDSWMLFDNSQARPVLIARRKGEQTEILEQDRWALVKKGRML